jgi:hypothetical protein
MLLPACHSLYVTVVMSLSRRYDFNMDYKDISERGSAEGCVEETVARLPHIANGVRSL